MSGRKKPLDEKEIEAYLTQLEDGCLSEDGLDDEDFDDEMHDADELRRYLEEENDEDTEVEETVVADMVDETLDTDPPLVQEEVNDQQSNYLLSYPIDKRKLIWKKRNMVYVTDKTTFLGIAASPDDITQLETPYQCFTQFITKDFVNKLMI